METVPPFIKELQRQNTIKWIILVADLPEVTKTQEEFYVKVAGSKTEYLSRCQQSAERIKNNLMEHLRK